MTITEERDTPSSYGTDPGDPARALFAGGVGEHLSPGAVTEFVLSALGRADLDGKRVCLVVPDGTPDLPTAAPATGRVGGAGREGHRGHRGDRAWHSPGNE